MTVAGPAQSLAVHADGTGSRFAVRVQPRAGHDAIVGTRAGALKVRLAAPPVDGKANAALLRCLADALDVPRADVTLRSGTTGRDKVVAVAGMSPEALRRRLAELVLEAAPRR